jgi:outer membrane lipoprotein-sorting protein
MRRSLWFALTFGYFASSVATAQDQPRLFQQSPSSLIGAWVNQDQKVGLTYVTIRQDGTRLLVHVLGRCTPLDCDWGEEVVGLQNEVGVVVWEQGFSTVKMQLDLQQDNRLKVESATVYHDRSGRKDSRRVEYFVRRVPRTPDPSVDPAGALLRQVAERYHTLPAGYFESITTVTQQTAQGEETYAMRMKTYYLPPDKMRSEIVGSISSVHLLDGTSDWRIYADKNEYQVLPQRSNGIANSVLGLYARVDPTRGTSQITGHEQIDGIACTVLQQKQDRDVTETYWIEDATYFIRKWTDDRGATYHAETVHPVARIGEPVKAELFTYDPNKTGAKERKSPAQ